MYLSSQLAAPAAETLCFCDEERYRATWELVKSPWILCFSRHRVENDRPCLGATNRLQLGYEKVCFSRFVRVDHQHYRR
jgi:hypothetical protein